MLLVGPISHTSTQYMDFVEVSIFHWICLLFITLILVGIELPLCIVVTLSQNAVTCFLESSRVSDRFVLLLKLDLHISNSDSPQFSIP